MVRKSAEVITIGGEAPSNGAEGVYNASIPYIATVSIVGIADYLYHRWNCEAVEAKANAAKGSKAKKTDDLETYVYRTEDGGLAIPGEQLRMAMIGAAKFRQDPRSPRKSAMDLYKAGVTVLTALAPVGQSEWDYEDRRRVMIQRNGVTRVRPALKAGWSVEFEIMINLPEYINPDDLSDVASNAGKLMGIGDFRPTFGRFRMDGFKIS